MQCNHNFYRSLNKSYSRMKQPMFSIFRKTNDMSWSRITQAENWVQLGVKRKPLLHIPNSISWPSSSCPFSASSMASSWSSRAVSAYLSKNSSSVSSCSSSDSSVSDSCQMITELCQHCLSENLCFYMNQMFGHHKKGISHTSIPFIIQHKNLTSLKVCGQFISNNFH